jgi:hypothetical protein
LEVPSKKEVVNFISLKLGTSMHAIISFIEMLLTISLVPETFFHQYKPIP